MPCSAGQAAQPMLALLAFVTVGMTASTSAEVPAEASRVKAGMACGVAYRGSRPSIIATITRWRVVMRPLPPAAGGLAVCRGVLVIDAGEVEEGVDGGLERTGVALDLGDEQTALECGQEGDGEVVRVGAVWKVPGVVQTA